MPNDAMLADVDAVTRDLPGMLGDLRSDHAGEAGWLTGFLPAVAGPRAVYATIAAVERFVVAHYEEQIRKLGSHGPAGALRATLQACQSDEAHHRDEAQALGERHPAAPLRVWAALVEFGSRYAVIAARRL